MKTTYQQPVLEVIGSVADITRFSGVPTRTDSVFRDGSVVPGSPNGVGSVDQCIFTGGPQEPGPAVCI